jgi:hypothetical protein
MQFNLYAHDTIQMTAFEDVAPGGDSHVDICR